MTASETGQVTSTTDNDYNLSWFTEKCRNKTLGLETYISDAQRQGDTELADFFRKAQAGSRKGADLSKQMLQKASVPKAALGPAR
jgi:hypothetical protein